MPSEATLIALDLETTGLAAGPDRIVEIGAIAFDAAGRVVETFERLVNPGRPIAATAREVNGIDDAELADAPPAAEVMPEFLDMLARHSGVRLLAHNAAFDAGFVGMELTLASLPIPDVSVLDTLPLARATLPDLRSHRLDLLLAHFEIAAAAKHRALADASAVMDLWFRLGGPSFPADDLVSYPIHDGSRPVRPPLGWERLDAARDGGRTVRIAYSGGSRGDAPRLVTPRSFAHRGGIAYLVATCHIDSIEKSFRLDRITTYEVVD